MKHIITLIILFTLGISSGHAQTWLKMAGKVVDESMTTYDGQEIKAGTKLELHEGTAQNGSYKHIYSMIGMQRADLGYGVDYETITIAEIRYSKKADQYFALAKISGRLYFVDVDKALKSGEVIKVINEEITATLE